MICYVSSQLVIGTRTMFRNVFAIISGGASGLGGATASYLVRHGARVVVADLPAAEESFEKLDAFTNANSSDVDVNDSLKFAKTDVTNEEDISFALDMAENEFGEQGEWIYHSENALFFSIFLGYVHSSYAHLINAILQ